MAVRNENDSSTIATTSTAIGTHCQLSIAVRVAASLWYAS